jgi:hypothetical protein
MVTPEVVGHIDPVCPVALKTNGKPGNRRAGLVGGADGHARCGSVTGLSRFLIGLVTCLATHDGIPPSPSLLAGEVRRTV